MISLFSETFVYTSKIDSKDYVFSALTIGDLADYCLWFKFKELDDFRRVTKELISPDLQEKMEREIYDRCYRRSLDFTDIRVIESFGTIEGRLRQLYLSIRKKHSNIKLSEIPYIVIPEDLKEVVDKISFLSGISEEQKEEDEILGES